MMRDKYPEFAGKTLLIIGAGHEQVPAIRIAQRMRVRVIATDQSASAPGAALADVFEQVSTADATGNLDVARKHNIDGVMTLGSETAVPVVALIAESLGLAGLSQRTALLATNKNAMRDAFRQGGVPTPLSQAIRSYPELRTFIGQCGLPVVIKPSDNSGQRGTSLISDTGHLEAALASAISFSTDGAAIVEEFCDGIEINVTAAVVDSNIHFLSLSNRVTGVPGHFGIAVEHVAPPSIDKAQMEAVKTASKAAIRAIGLQNGIAYPQVIVTPRGPRVIEIAARIPGGHMREVGLHVSGLDMIEIAVCISLGATDPLALCQRYPRAEAVYVRFLTALDMERTDVPVLSVSGLEDAQAAPGVHIARMNITPGHEVPELNSSAGRFGAILTTGSTADEARSRAQRALSLIHVSYATDES